MESLGLTVTPGPASRGAAFAGESELFCGLRVCRQTGSTTGQHPEGCGGERSTEGSSSEKYLLEENQSCVLSFWVCLRS